LSILVYTLIIAMITTLIIMIKYFNTIPLETISYKEEFIFNPLKLEKKYETLIFAIIAILILTGLKITEFFLIIYASLNTSNN